MLLLGVILSIEHVGRQKLVGNTRDAYVSSRVLQFCLEKQTRHASNEEVNRNRNAIIPSPTALESRYEQHGRDRVLEIGEMLSSSLLLCFLQLLPQPRQRVHRHLVTTSILTAPLPYLPHGIGYHIHTCRGV